MNSEIVINIDPAGGVRALHMDEFPLRFLGPMEHTRASTIDFNPATQLFDVMLKGATRHPVLLHSYPESALHFLGYDEAREFEVLWIQACMKAGVDPLDAEGIAICNALRDKIYPQL